MYIVYQSPHSASFPACRPENSSRWKRSPRLETGGAVVDAGATLESVDRAAALHGLALGIDLPARGSATLGGSFSAEHGIGIEKKASMHKLVDPVKLELMRSIKRLLDPNGIMNPGKIFQETS